MIQRIVQNLLVGPWTRARYFTSSVLREVEERVGRSERTHGGQICVAIESGLTIAEVLSGKTPRERATEAFSELRVWDTAHNNGVLLFLLLSERAVEILADRGAAAVVPPHRWEEICSAVEQELRQGRYGAGISLGVELMASELAHHYPPSDGQENELPNSPVMV